MSGPEHGKTGGKQRCQPMNVKLSVRDFGPIAEGEVDLRPLTVFVGPSNTGKTYMALLLYALHRVFSGFPRLPLLDREPNPASIPTQRRERRLRRRIIPSETTLSSEDLQEVFRKLNTEGRPFRLTDLPGWRNGLKDELNDFQSFEMDLSRELFRCFDLLSEAEIIRKPGPTSSSVSLKVNEKAERLWRVDIRVSETNCDVEVNMEEDAILVYGDRSIMKTEAGRLADFFRHEEDIWTQTLIQLLMDLGNGQLGVHCNPDVHFVPAIRGSIMHSHRLIASALLSDSARGGLESSRVFQTFSGGVADLIQALILYRENTKETSGIKRIADHLEREILGGRIELNHSISGYPEYAYRPDAMSKRISLSRAPSMVAELAPVVLFLRGTVKPGDTLIVEEPEAHLHPAAQIQIAIALARLVRQGVRIVLTTHSDWLLQEIANLMRVGETVNQRESDDTSSGWLMPQEVGVWQFIKDHPGGGSRLKEIPYDRVEGVYPEDYEDLEEALYNRSADLQNTLADLERTRSAP